MIKVVKLGIIEFVISLKDNFTGTMKKARNSAKSTATSITTRFQKMGLAMKAVWLAIGIAVVQAFRKIISNTEEAELATARLQQQLINLGIAGEDTLKKFQILANQLQTTTGISNDAFISTAALTASYQLNAKQISEVLPILADLTAFTRKTTGQQKQLEDSVILMGQAMKGAAGRLEQMGITLSDVQRELLLTGTRSEKLAAFMQAVTDNAGGLAEAMGKTTTGEINNFKNTMADLGKEIGSVILPILGFFANGLVKLSQTLKAVTVGASAGIQKLGASFKLFFKLLKGEGVEAAEEFEDSIRKITEEAERQIEEIAGLSKVQFENTEAVKELADSYEGLTKELSELDSIRKENLVTYGAESEAFKKSNENFLEAEKRLTAYNEVLKGTTQVTKEAKEQNELLREEISQLAREAINTGDLQISGGEVSGIVEGIQEKFKQLQTNSAESNKKIGEKIDEQKKKVTSLKDEYDKVNITVSENFTTAVESSQPSRTQLLTDVTAIANELTRIKEETIAINELTLESPLLDINQ